MNAIQIDNRIEFYLDATRNARYPRTEKSGAVNDAIKKFIDYNFGDADGRNPNSFEFTQQQRDNLYTLIKDLITFRFILFRHATIKQLFP